MEKAKIRAGVTTKVRILDAAESLFSQFGYAAVTTRQIAQKAKVVLSALPYYFGSKREILRQILDRYMRPMQIERARLYEVVTAERLEGQALVRRILEALLVPAFGATQQHRVYFCLMGIMSTDPNPEVRELLNEVMGMYPTGIPAGFREAVPGLTDVEFYRRFYCVIGAMIYVQLDTGRMAYVTGNALDFSAPQENLDLMVNFFLAGLCAPASKQVIFFVCVDCDPAAQR
ncbi:TetR/AcrR family transcriptional regulator [Sphingopyxis witflariensis]|uniref:HTH tetR-type domain-containing protein n=1 Tax=Sphingopyxis witflariensis TaxID=173675 RepID=A0A246K5E6_9SPHN|nr:TetR/AcrR family transcriptional regulator [Sphingopyxis witflariensis]OWR00218.1 hypothetical protein CDQ91_05505 [Sphingopyxis witflariensis]